MSSSPPSSSKIKVKFVIDKEQERVVFAEAGGEFVDVLFSFLTLPLGRIRQLFDYLMGSLDTLYESVQQLDVKHLLTEACKEMLLNPRIKNLLLELEEIKPTESTVLMSCVKCYLDNGCKTCTSAPCVHGLTEAKFVEQNPKWANGATNNGRAFVVGSKRFMVSDSLEISPLSASSAILERMLSLTDIVEVEVFVDRDKARSLLSAMMISSEVLTDVFSPELKRWRKSV
ncbi:hypothetical protein KSP39_PZI022658 [Platanthera zijinensis]|uniref:Uncharacterized protein n=1 Tax=Platanthera zijinensis TaxID=2320716 RepID=A0AAP0FV26_9ASPA